MSPDSANQPHAVRHELAGACVVATASWTAPVLWRFAYYQGIESGRGLPQSKTLRKLDQFNENAAVPSVGGRILKLLSERRPPARQYHPALAPKSTFPRPNK